ncbi:MAG: WD40 repeat domain-containing protein [Candidatus Bipolaricaulis sp.]|jgi:WD40 repeat protein
MRLVQPLLVSLIAIAGAIGVAEQVHWIVDTCPPSEPFTYCTVAEDGWNMVSFDESWQHLALVFPWRIDVLDPYSRERLASLQPPSHLKFNIMPAFSKDGSLIACAVSDGTVRVWDWRTGRELHAFPGSSWGNTPAFSHDGELLAALGPTGEIAVWDLKTGEPVLFLPQLRTFIGPVVLGFDHDDRRLFVRAQAPGSSAHITCVWDTLTGELIHVFPGMAQPFSQGWVFGLEPTPDGRTHVWRWEEERGTLATLFLAPGPMTGASFSRDGSLLALALSDGTVRLLDMGAMGRELYRLDPGLVVQGSEGRWRVVHAFFSPDSTLLATATWVSGTSRAYVHLWSAAEIQRERE